MRGNIMWNATGKNEKGHTRRVPVAKGAIYPYSSKRQNERNLRKCRETHWVIPKGFVIKPEWCETIYPIVHAESA